LIVLEPSGEIQLNVLAAEDDISFVAPSSGDVEIDRIATGNVSDASVVKLSSDSGKVSLDIYGENGIKTLNVTDYKENILEVMERPDVQRLEIGLRDDKFQITNNGIIALTSLPITVDSKSAELTIKTDDGDRNLDIFPSEAVQTALRTKFLSKVNAGGVEIVSTDNELQYKISGEKTLNLLNVYDYSIPISSYISASSGEVLKVDAPGWLRFINFIFS